MARPPRKPLSELNVGEELEAVVKNVVRYGLFLDAGCAMDVFVHVSDIAHTFVPDAAEILKRGMKVKLRLIEVGPKLKGSLKDLNDFEIKTPKQKQDKRGRRDTKRYAITDEFEGVVEKVTARGAFVKFDDGHSTGFLPVEEISLGDEKPGNDVRADDLIQAAQVLTVRVMETDGKSGRHTLSTRAYEEIESERKGKEEGYFINGGDSDDEDAAILSAAFKRAGIVRDMFAGADKNGKRKTKKDTEMEASTLSKPSDATADVAAEETTPSISEDDRSEVAEEIVSESQTVETEESEVVAGVSSFEADISDSETTKEEEATGVEDKLEESKAPLTGDVEVAESEAPSVAEATEIQESEIEESVPDIASNVDARLDQPSTEDAPTPSITEASSEPPSTETEPTATPDPEPAVESSTNVVSASLVKELREASGAGMMDCKKALTECNGDMDAAIEYLKKKGIASAAKRAGKVASEGIIGSYIHTGNKLGILLEVNSETDFVARTEAFQTFVEDVAMTIAANPDAICIRPEDYPEDALNKEKEMELAKDDLQNKPEDIKQKIVAGRLEKIKKTAAVVEQPFIQNQDTTVQDALNEITASLGEKIVIRRFARYELGEGLEKKSTDFAAEVADQIEAKKAEAAAKAESSVEEEEPTSTEAKSDVTVSAAMVKELRQMTGGGLMDCKKALMESEGDMDKAVEYLRVKGLAGAAKKASRLASEGVIASYIHLGSRLGIMAEINCETDFVARGDVFRQLADDIAMQLAANPDVMYISSDVVPRDVVDKEMEIEMQVEDLQSKPENIREKIADGRARKTISSMCLFDQASLKDPEKTIGDVVKEHIASLGENIKVRRFVRFNLGEGIDKPETDFAKEVAEQTTKE